MKTTATKQMTGACRVCGGRYQVIRSGHLREHRLKERGGAPVCDGTYMTPRESGPALELRAAAMSGPTAGDMARLRWQGTTKAERSAELRRVALAGWKHRPRAQKPRKRPGEGKA